MTKGNAPVRLDLPCDRELRARVFHGLATALTTSARGAAAVLETSDTGQAPELWINPPELVPALLATPAMAGARVSPVPRSSRPEGDSGWTTWALAPVASPTPPASPSPFWEVPERARLIGENGALQTQTFWVSGREDGRLWIARRARFRGGRANEDPPPASAVAAYVAAEWSRATGLLCRPRRLRSHAAAWQSANGRSFRRTDWLAVPPAVAVHAAEPILPSEYPRSPDDEGHAIALGSTGAGKTTYLAERAAARVRHGGTVVVVDLHGDLSGAIVSRLAHPWRGRLLGVDAGRRPVVGVSALRGTDARSAAQFVAAVKRLTPDGADIYWGFRLERLFDAFVRLVQELGGDLGDLYALLTDASRREAARLATRSPELARFLDELGPIVRRNPDFLWSAAARLAKVVLVPELAELLAPVGGGIPVEEALDAGRSLLVRIPFAELGPEAASFAGSLVVARVYLGLVARREARPTPVTIVLDEVQGFSPRLIGEMLTEGRKFGVRCLFASQFPERLAPELRLAAAGGSRGVVAFRVPRAAAAAVGAWIGIGRGEAELLLPELPTGHGLYRDPGDGSLRTLVTRPSEGEGSTTAWEEVVAATQAAHPPTASDATERRDEAAERLLLAVLAAEERGVPIGPDRWSEESVALPGPEVDRATLDDRIVSLQRGGAVRSTPDGLRLTPAGERMLGLHSATGASRESAEHRALLLRTFRLFARHGYRLEIVRQGRYDTTLPDALFHQLGDRARDASPRALADAIEAAQRGWAWRAFSGRDVHVEAEVSGALRADRIRHGWEKAHRRGAFALFVVGDAARASRVRRVLGALGVRPDRAQVWTLRNAGPARERIGPGTLPPA